MLKTISNNRNPLNISVNIYSADLAFVPMHLPFPVIITWMYSSLQCSLPDNFRYFFTCLLSILHLASTVIFFYSHTECLLLFHQFATFLVLYFCIVHYYLSETHPELHILLAVSTNQLLQSWSSHHPLIHHFRHLITIFGC